MTLSTVGRLSVLILFVHRSVRLHTRNPDRRAFALAGQYRSPSHVHLAANTTQATECDRIDSFPKLMKPQADTLAAPLSRRQRVVRAVQYLVNCASLALLYPRCFTMRTSAPDTLIVLVTCC
ncbi:hypothetical protein DFH94DRAFT_154720 [Russula ochroleuca]|jgi:hypothetical protein|uniref:Uncharacterized protein n=1 Tax=Russula ochroleuca TaxID=152965 RepID=A0A9P5N3J2_9AGAM|nr:hypothetical protein DFH94DRAFT_154720 [Russula ochroleuca]